MVYKENRYKQTKLEIDKRNRGRLLSVMIRVNQRKTNKNQKKEKIIKANLELIVTFAIKVSNKDPHSQQCETICSQIKQKTHQIIKQ